MLKPQHGTLTDSGLLGRTAGCRCREISSLPLAQWAMLALGLSIVTTGRRAALQQLYYSAPDDPQIGVGWVGEKKKGTTEKRMPRGKL